MIEKLTQFQNPPPTAGRASLKLSVIAGPNDPGFRASHLPEKEMTRCRPGWLCQAEVDAGEAPTETAREISEFERKSGALQRS